MRKSGFVDFNVDTSTPFSCIPPIDSLNHVEFREELLTGTPKHRSHAELLRQLALEIGTHCFSGAFDHALNSCKDSIWIPTDSRGSIQYLKNWPKIIDSTGQYILSKFVRLGQRKQVCLQWIPSHGGVSENEAADELTGRGCDLSNPSSTVLTHSEIHSFQRNKMNLTWQNHLTHHWYAAKSPGLSIECRSSRAHQTALARFRSGHLRSMTFVQGVKSFFTCPCSLPAHLLDCRVISLRQFYEEQGLMCETITRNGQMNLV
ncbi:putative RNA-directed DNA polymerase from transposon BS [Trichonephila clavipes]|nr:putative RNA-directed DNA polymerase from transposon BS [Trichonephila clavipes]